MAKTGHPNFDYTCSAYWRGTLRNFSIVGNHSGTSFGQADAQAFMEGANSPMALTFGPLMSSKINVVSSRYYDGQNSAPVFVNLYNTGNPPPADIVPSGSAWGAVVVNEYLPLEVCLDISSELGLSKTSKPVYNRKYLRGVPAGAIAYDTNGEMIFHNAGGSPPDVTSMGDGTWYQGRVYISPTAKSANNWLCSEYPGNHQKLRGRKRKVTSASSGISASSLLKDAIALAGGVVLAGA